LLAKRQSGYNLPDGPGVFSNFAGRLEGRPFVCAGVRLLSSKTAEQRERAEAKFERLQKVAEEGRIAMADYRAAAAAMRQKTERLRALRLALAAEAAAATRADAAKNGAKSTSKRVKQHQKTH
jgi:N-methylhydantoinase B/oxoprolinase/acetone carboxylase alpha subunit